MQRPGIKKLRSLVVTIAFVLAVSPLAITATDIDIRWVDIDPEKHPKLAKTMEGQCLPDVSRAPYALPIDAQVLFVFWDEDRPSCDDPGEISTAEVESLILLSRQTKDDVIWKFRYVLSDLDFSEHHLPRESDTDPCCLGNRHSKSGMDEPRQETVFVRLPIETFCWNEHLYTAPQVIIKEAYGIYEFSGYRTLIEIFRPNLTMPAESRAEAPSQEDGQCS